ncbi:MAG TPA: DUF4835 family protein [Bacteroidota bacterium]|nr:DUF4835 family protein [Bacteroidota bacterium]
MIPRIALTILTLVLPACVLSQELDCDVTITTSQLTTEAKENLANFESQVKDYFNGYRWTKDDFGNDKIHCSINIAFLGMTSPNHYVAKAFIGSQRPVFKMNQNTAVLRILDDKWEFDYTRTQAMTHVDSHFDPLLSFFDFYAYIILGYDADTYKDTHEGGKATEYFQKAKDITNRAIGSGQIGSGWDVTSQSTYTRGQLIEELTNPKFQPVRDEIYRYHYHGLDLYYKDEGKARSNIFSAIEKLAKFQKKVNQPVLLVRTFFDTKYLEIADKFTGDQEEGIFDKLEQIDPMHIQTYENLKSKSN